MFNGQFNVHPPNFPTNEDGCSLNLDFGLTHPLTLRLIIWTHSRGHYMWLAQQSSSDINSPQKDILRGGGMWDSQHTHSCPD